MFKALSRLFGSKPKAPRLSIPVPGASASLVKTAPVSAPETGSSAASNSPAPSSSASATAPPTPSAKARWQQESSPIPLSAANLSPEQLCGVSSSMTPEEIRARLSKLYQRHNRAASSLDPVLREEAEFMLETLAGLRDQYLGTAPQQTTPDPD
ncbi:MAG: hypothetical protein JWL81_2844 [Verrucomicrobiales bacterium]|nr:hypothetical protein [Verrucomicrobiales bacterium]